MSLMLLSSHHLGEGSVMMVVSLADRPLGCMDPDFQPCGRSKTLRGCWPGEETEQGSLPGSRGRAHRSC